MSKVYVIQNQHRIDDRSGNLVPKFNLEAATQFGDLVYLLSSTAKPFFPQQVIEQLYDKLKDYGDSDYLLLIGNPCLIGFAVAVASEMNDGRVKVLQWDGKKREYISVEADLLPH